MREGEGDQGKRASKGNEEESWKWRGVRGGEGWREREMQRTKGKEKKIE
jgi:hypothetical protein